MKYQDFEIVDEKIVYHGFYSVKTFRLRFQLFRGGWSEVMTRELVERPQAAAALPYDPVLDKVVLIEQFRVGALRDPTGPWLLELVAGLLEDNESEAQLVDREMQEEAGLKTLACIPVCHYWVSPGGTNESVALFCAKVDASNAGGVYGVASEHEDIKVHVISPEKAFEYVRTGRVNNAASIIALQWLELQDRQNLFHHDG